MSKLKPCPHCGGTDLEMRTMFGEYEGADSILCMECLSLFTKMELTCEEDLVEAWNRRADA